MVTQSVGRTARLLKERIIPSASGINILMLGKAGVGKSTIIGDLADCRIDSKKEVTYTREDVEIEKITEAEWDTFRKVTVFDIRLSAYTVNDITISMPKSLTEKDLSLNSENELSAEVNNMMVTFYAEWIVKLTEAAKAGDKIILFFDELTHAQLPVLRIMYRILAEREIDNIKLPDDMVVIGASNKVEEDSQMTELPGPLLDRFQMMIELVTDVEDSIKWYMSKKYYSIVSFLRTFPDKLYASVTTKEMVKTISPRTWEKIGLLVNEGTVRPCDAQELASGYTVDYSETILNGILGLEIGSSFKTFLDDALEVDIDKMITDCSFEGHSNQVKYAIFSGVMTHITTRIEKAKQKGGPKKGALEVLTFLEYLFANDKQYLSVILLEKDIKMFAIKNTKNKDFKKLILTLV